MPYPSDLSMNLATSWENEGGSISGAVSGNMYLYWGQKENEYNHIHIFNGGKEYNIKCNGDDGKYRKNFFINEEQSMEDFIQELQTNWLEECNEYITDYNLGNDQEKRKQFKKQQKQQQKQKKQPQYQQQQYQQPQYNQYQQPQQSWQQPQQSWQQPRQSNDRIDWEYKYLKYKNKYLEIKKMIENNNLNLN